MTRILTTEEASTLCTKLRQALSEILLGQETVVEQVLVALLARGHVLLEGVPGLGKTLLVRALASCFDGNYRRIQFTPDLMPADITGHAIYNMTDSNFRVRRGPVFTNLLLADEVNRASAKTQAALLEVMQERQVTIEGETHHLDPPFMVLATQNPIEQEGTYPLPEAQLDRFLMKVVIDYPDFEDEAEVTRQVTEGRTEEKVDNRAQSPTIGPDDVIELSQAVSNIEVDSEIINYAVRLTRATRNHPGIRVGASPRASIGLIQCAKACALLQTRQFILPEDVKRIAIPVLRHRLVLTADTEIDGYTPDDILGKLLEDVDAPRQ